MGAWGLGLFQSDQDLDDLGDISSDVGKLINEPDVNLYVPDNPEHLAAKLNDGVFHQLLVSYQAKKWRQGVIILGAAMMQVGGHISEDDMKILRTTLKKTPMFGEAKAQMKKALKEYKNDGTLWDFGSLGLDDTAMMAMSGGGPTVEGKLDTPVERLSYELSGDMLTIPGVPGGHVLKPPQKSSEGAPIKSEGN